MSVPISAMITAEAAGPMPGMVISRSRSARKGTSITSICLSTVSISSVSSSMWRRCSLHMRAWWSLNRPDSAIDRSGILLRSTPRASSASTAPRRSPSISALIISREDTPSTSEATESILIPASSSVFCSLWISLVREPMSLARYLVRSRSSAIFWTGMYDPRSRPHSSNSASQAQSAASSPN